MDSDSYISRPKASEFLHQKGFDVAPATLAKYACLGGGPSYVSFGRRALYSPNELLRWAESRARVRRNTSDAGEQLTFSTRADSEGV